MFYNSDFFVFMFNIVVYEYVFLTIANGKTSYNIL